MDVVYCKKCHNKKRIKDYGKAQKEIEDITDAKVEDSCISYCGPGKKEHFAVIDDEIITGDTYEELIKNIKEELC